MHSFSQSLSENMNANYHVTLTLWPILSCRGHDKHILLTTGFCKYLKKILCVYVCGFKAKLKLSTCRCSLYINTSCHVNHKFTQELVLYFFTVTSCMVGNSDSHRCWQMVLNLYMTSAVSQNIVSQEGESQKAGNRGKTSVWISKCAYSGRYWLPTCDNFYVKLKDNLFKYVFM